jgi:hypothetical protein
MVADIVKYSFNIIRKKPKIILPQLLSFIPLFLFAVLFDFASGDFIELVPGTSQEGFTNVVIKYFVPSVAIFIISALVTVFINGVYPEIIRHAFYQKDVVLSAALNKSKARFRSMLWTHYVLLMLLLAPLVAAGFALALIALLVPLIFLLFAIGAIIAIVYVVPGIYMLSTVVVLENLSGIEAIKRSFALSRGRMLSIWGAILLIGIFSIGLYMLILLPMIGVLLYLPVVLFAAAWGISTPSVYYFMRVKKVKPRL